MSWSFISTAAQDARRSESESESEVCWGRWPPCLHRPGAAILRTFQKECSVGQHQPWRRKSRRAEPIPRYADRGGCQTPSDPRPWAGSCARRPVPSAASCTALDAARVSSWWALGAAAGDVEGCEALGSCRQEAQLLRNESVEDGAACLSVGRDTVARSADLVCSCASIGRFAHATGPYYADVSSTDTDTVACR